MWPLLLVLLATPLAHAAEENATSGVDHRPAAVWFDSTSDRLWVANAGSGTLTRIDTGALAVGETFPIGKQPVQMESRPDSSLVLLDRGLNELIVTRLDEQPHILSRLPVTEHASRFCLDPSGESAFVTSLWNRCVERISLVDGTRQTLPLPFAASELLLLPDRNILLVADAFRGRIAMIDLTAWSLSAIREFNGHNIQGLQLSSDGRWLYVVHSHLNPLARADFDDVTWGILLFHGVRGFRLDRLLDPQADFIDGNRAMTLGMPEDHAADPGRITRLPDGRLVTLLTGTGQVAWGSEQFDQTRVEVGQHPVDVAFDPGRDRLYVANQFDNSISVVDLAHGLRLRDLPLGPHPQLTPEQRGERLFFDARISHDRWMSCHTCHSRGHTVDDLVDTLGDGDYGAPKRIPSLLGVGRTGPWAWIGNKQTLADQVRLSLDSTMHGPPLAREQVEDLLAYLRSLEPPPPVPLPGPPDQAATLLTHGENVFKSLECARCHSGDVYTSDGTYDVGLVDERGRQEFNPPSLRGVGQRMRLLHDVRATSLEDLFRNHRHQLDAPLAEDDLRALVAFLSQL